MSKIGRNKKRCEHYRTSGNLQTNKLLKQKRNEKLIAKFTARREAGKAYEYKTNPYIAGSEAYMLENETRAMKNVDRRMPLQRFTSIMRRLDNMLMREVAERKVIKERKKKLKSELAQM